MSSDSDKLAISVRDLCKRYEMYDAPRDRLKQFVFPRLARYTGKPARSYFHEFWAIRDVSFEVKKGESVGIMGRNGSGKSTLLQIITGTLSPTSGSVKVNGRIAALLELGSGFNPEFSGRENVYLNGALLGFSAAQIDARFDAIASFADIGPYLDQPVKTYSSGMMLRLAFAVQVQVEPEILIVDEALAVGDALFQKRCFQRIERMVSDGTTLLFVSHDQESVRTLTNRALLLSKGKVISLGLSSDVILNYRKLLHDEEYAYFSSLTKELVDKAQAARESEVASISEASNKPEGQTPEKSLLNEGRSESLTFGDGGVNVVQVDTLDADENPCSVYHPGDFLRIRVKCQSRLQISKLNIALRIRNKEGIKIYSWGTLNQDMSIRARSLENPIFWNRTVNVEEIFFVDFQCICSLGANLYEVQAAVTYEETPDYMSQRMLHWVDEAAFFQVSVRRDENFFGGVVDLGMSAVW